METTYRRGIFITFIVTFVLLVAMIVVWKLKFYDDVNAQIATTQADLDKNQETGKNLPAELKAEAIAKEQLVLANEQLNYFRQRFRSLNFDLTPGAPLNRTWRGYMNEYFADYGLEMRRQLVQAADDTGVVLNTTVKVDAPPQLPELVSAPPTGFLKPITGSTLNVDVTGAFPDILRFLERVNRSPILMTVGAIKVEGASPALKATFTITPYLVAKGPAVKLPAAAPATPAEGGGEPPVEGESPVPAPTPSP